MRYCILFSVALFGFAFVACAEQGPSDLSAGEPAAIDGLKLTVDRYEVLRETSGSGSAKPGGEYLLVRVTAENAGQGPVDEYADWFIQYGGGEVSGSLSTDLAHPSFDPAIRLFPGSTSEGWEQFEVPQDLDFSLAVVVLKFGAIPPAKTIASWRLTLVQKTNGH